MLSAVNTIGEEDNSTFSEPLTCCNSGVSAPAGSHVVDWSRTKVWRSRSRGAGKVTGKRDSTRSESPAASVSGRGLFCSSTGRTIQVRAASPVPVKVTGSEAVAVPLSGMVSVQEAVLMRAIDGSADSSVTCHLPWREEVLESSTPGCRFRLSGTAPYGSEGRLCGRLGYPKR